MPAIRDRKFPKYSLVQCPLFGLCVRTAGKHFEIRYNLPCCLALAGRTDEATAELEALVEEAPGVFDEAITRDPDMDSLRDREDFKRLLE